MGNRVSKPKKYVSKPVVIEAMQYTEENRHAILEWAKGDVTSRKIRSSLDNTKWPIALAIETIEGEVFASLGDWIVKGIEGEFYPCKDSIFRAKYEEKDKE